MYFYTFWPDNRYFDMPDTHLPWWIAEILVDPFRTLLLPGTASELPRKFLKTR